MRWLWIVLVVFPQVAWADVTVIYRKTDFLVAGWVRPPQAVETELSNVLNSQLGGTRNDYATVVVPDAEWQKGKKVTVNPSGKVKFIEYPQNAERQANAASVRAKLNALGFSAKEADTLLP